MRRRRIGTLTLVLLVALLAIAALAGTAAAQGTGGGYYGCGGCGGWPGTGGTGGGGTGTGGWCGGGTWNGSGTWGGTGAWGTAFGGQWLTTHPEAFSAWLDLRIKNLETTKAWYDQYQTDLRSTAARQALKAVWQQNWTDMKAWYQKYGSGAGWTCPGSGCWGSGMWGAGYGSGYLLGHSGAFGDYLDLRISQANDVKAWLTQYSSDLTGSAAQTALQSMRTDMRTQVKKF